jgi:uncharacterized protein (UPF0254 family)
MPTALPFVPSAPEIPDIPPQRSQVEGRDGEAIWAERTAEVARMQQAFTLKRTALFTGIGGAAGAGAGALVGKLAGNTKKGATYGALVGAVLPHVSEKARMGVLLIAMVFSGGVPRY